MEQTDYSAYEQAPEDTTKLDQLNALAEAQKVAAERVEDAELELRRAKEQLVSLEEQQIPELMDELGIEEYTPTDGEPIKIVEKIRASIPVAKRPEAMGWIREHKYTRLIKHTIKCDFSMGEDEEARRMAELLGQEGLEFSDTETVHPATLASFVKEKLKRGEELPLDLLGVFRQRVAKVGK